MRLRHAVPAGLLDVGCASLATFLIGLVAARELDPATLGAYSIFFSAFLMAVAVPAALVFTPCQVAMLRLERSARTALVGRSLALGLPLAVLASALAIGIAAVGAADARPGVVLALALSAGACTVLSPLQDQVRRTLHLAGASWRAASVSVVQLVAVGVTVLALLALGVEAVWLPFSALGVANLCSMTAGLALAGRGRAGRGRAGTHGRARLPPFRELLVLGRWLLVASLVAPAGGFVVALVITQTAGPVALGYAEAARTVAQPVLVLGMGLGATLGPRLMEAGAARDEHASRVIRRPFLGLVLGLGGCYALATSVRWVGNPIGLLIPNAYDVTGLALTTAVAYVIVAAAFCDRAELIGGGRERRVARAELIGTTAAILVAGTAASTGAFARPLSAMVQGLVLVQVLRAARRRLGAEPAPAGERPEIEPVAP